MAEKRETGLAVSGRGKAAVEGRVVRKAPQPASCRRFARERYAEALPEIAETLLGEAKKGSVPHLKAFVELCGWGKAVTKSKRRGRTLEEMLLEQWAKAGIGTE